MKSYDMILLSWFVFNLRPPSPNHPLLESITSQILKKILKFGYSFHSPSTFPSSFYFVSWLIPNWFYFSFLPPSLSLFVVPDFLHFRRFCNPFWKCRQTAVRVEGSFSPWKNLIFNSQVGGLLSATGYLLTIFQVTCRDLCCTKRVILSLITMRDSSQNKLLKPHYPVRKSNNQPLIKTGIWKKASRLWRSNVNRSPSLIECEMLVTVE